WKVAYVLAPLAAVWIAVALGLSRAFSRVLEVCLAKRRLDRGALSLGDASSRAILDRWLKSADPVEVLYALSVLPAEDAAMPEVLVGLLDHPSAEVRREALARLEARPSPAAGGRADRLLESEPSPA